MKRVQKITQINKENIFRTPPRFFEQNRQEILKKAGIESTPVPFPKENVFRVPPKFFTQLPEAVQGRIAARRQRRAVFRRKMRILLVSSSLVGLSLLFFWLKTTFPTEKYQLWQMNKVAMPLSMKLSDKKIKTPINIQNASTKVDTMATYQKIPIPKTSKEAAIPSSKLDTKKALQNIPRQEVIAYLHDESEIPEAEIIDFVMSNEQEAAGDFLDSLDIPKEWILEELNTEEIDDLLWEEQ